MDPQQSDHDLLITLNAKFDALSRDFRDMSDNSRERITRLEETRLEKQVYNDFLIEHKEFKKTTNDSLAMLNKWHWIAWGVVTTIQVIIGYYLLIHYGTSGN